MLRSIRIGLASSSWLRVTIGVWALLFSGSCGGTPTEPSSKVPTDLTGPPDYMFVEHLESRYSDGVTTFRVWAQWGSLKTYEQAAIVTDTAAWQSNSPSVTVVAPGQLASGSPGDAEVVISYQGKSITERFRVFAGEPPLWIIQPKDLSNAFGRSLPGARVEIVSGHEAGRVTLADDRGLYRFATPFLCGPGTLRATKDGYQEVVSEPAFLCIQLPYLNLMPL